LGIIALVAVIGVSFAACGGDDGGNNENENKGDPDLTGNLTITVAGGGSAIIGKQLTATYSGSETVSYNWTRGATEVATTATYMPDTAGSHTVTVSATGFKSKSASVTVSSPPALGGTVSISGTARVGEILTAITSNLQGTGTISYQWKWANTASAAGTDIIDATSSTYTLVEDDHGKFITITVTRAGYSGSKTSTATAAVGDALPALTGTVSITGSRTVGSQLSAITNSLQGSGTIRYQWKRADTESADGTNIVGSSSVNNYYTLITADLGKYITVTATRVNNSGSITSSAIGPVVVSWIAVADSTFGSSRIVDIAYGGDKFVAVGYVGKMAYSLDGTTWTAVADSTFGRINISDIAYGGDKFVAVGNEGKMAYSLDGTTWTAVEDSKFGTVDISDIAYGGDKFVAGGSNGKMAYSLDGITWTAVANSTFGSSSIYGIAYGGNKFFAVGQRGNMAYSLDGITWTQNSAFFGTTDFSCIAWGGTSGNEKFVAVVYSTGNNVIAYSTNGTTWTWASTRNIIFNDSFIRDIAYGGDKFVAVGNSGNMAYSLDGRTWTAVGYSPFGNTYIYSIAWGGAAGQKKFVAGDDDGKMAYSTIGE
jgi:hypothetical protein